ncbi:MAG TPA: hypothetical protein PKC58_16670, partial [Ignavibacteria bacterium]|nr:hypothetical protein [Ignavibacteria bacterium]
MKKILLLIIITMTFFAFKPKDESPDRKRESASSDNPSAIIDSKQMDANSISTWYRTNGSFNRDPATGNAGFEWPKGSGKTARYASGLWLGCVSGNDTLVAVAEYSYDFQPGYIDDYGDPQTDSTYRIYKIDQSNINSYDYLHWPGNQGAYMSSDNKPFPLGDQTMYFVMTDGFGHMSNNGSTRPLNVQILQTNWTYNPYEPFLQFPVNPFNNTIFMEYRIINRSKETWNNMWIGLWTDDDLGVATDDKIACDTNLNLGYTFNSTNNDGVYGIAPPAVGLKFLRGNYKYTGNFDDTIKYFQPFGSKNIKTKIGYKDEGMTVFNFYNGGSPQPSDPSDPRETYNVLKGLWKLGQHWVNPVTHDTTTLPYSGDPVTGTGWVMSQQNDIRSLTGTGPFDNINPGDTLTFVVAQIIARGSSNLNSITQLRNTARIIQNFYDNNLAPQQVAPSPDVSSYAPGDGKIYLTWDDTGHSKTFKNLLTGGTYNFQGYNIYQIRSFASQPSANDTVLLKTFDIADGIKNILDSTFIPPNPGIFYGIVQRGSDNGIAKYLEIDNDTLANRKFINGTEYKFAVTSYYYDSTGGLYTYPKVWESPKSNIIKVIPQNLTPGTQTSYELGDTIYTDQKDLAVMPVIVDPFKLVNASYTSTFGGTNANPNWTVTRNIYGSVTTLFENVYNFTGQQDSAKTADGLMFIHRYSSDSGIINDPDAMGYYNIPENRRVRAWTFEPTGMEWFTSPDTNAIYNASYTSLKVIRQQFQSRSLGMSFPTYNTFRNSSSQVKANGNYFKTLTPTSNILTGGPLRKIKIIFGQSQKAYRYKSTVGNVLLTDTILVNTPYADFVNVPFSAFSADELDSTNGIPRQLNVAFIDADNDGTWNPDTTGMGRFQYTYILASTYDSTVFSDYIGKNPGLGGGSAGFSSMDIMYAWLPRVKNNNGVP